MVQHAQASPVQHRRLSALVFGQYLTKEGQCLLAS